MRQWFVAVLAATITAAAGFFLAAASASASAAQPRQLTGYAWSSNIGWIKFSGPDYGVNLDPASGYFSGYAWSPNVGWLRFGEFIGRFGDSYPAEPKQGARWDKNSNEISGWARFCSGAEDQERCRGGANPLAPGWDGWIKFSGGSYRTHLTKNRCVLRGWAWGDEGVGWIRFRPQGVSFKDCAEEQVKEEEPEPEPESEPPPAEKPRCDFTAAPATVAKGGAATLRWDCGTTADSCSIPSLGFSDGPVAGSRVTGSLARTTAITLTCRKAGVSADFTATIRVVRPVYCEVIPFIGSCK